MNNFKVLTIGCKTNYSDSVFIVNALTKKGFISVTNEKDADFFIINSCTVTSRADSDTLRLVKNLKNKFPHKKIILTGCLAQLYKSIDNDFLNYIDLLVGNTKKFLLPEILCNEDIIKNKVYVDDNWDKSNSFYNLSLEKFTQTRTRAFLKIQDGCNGECSYCAIRLARGKSRSLKIDTVINNIKSFAKLGFKEIHLIGVRLGSFGLDNNESLLQLLKLIESLSLDLRVRLGSLHPTEITDDFLSLFLNSKKICPHIHISQQNLNDFILKKMNRNYSFSLFNDVVEKIREKRKDVFIGCDLIVGFPFEDESILLDNFEKFKKINISDAHIFPYSDRRFTISYNFNNKIDADLKKRYVKLFCNEAKIKKHKFINNLLGFVRPALVEKQTTKTNNIIGLTDNFLQVNLPLNCKDKIGSIINVKMEKFENEVILGNLV